MTIEDFREYCILKEGAEESFPFDENILVFKISGKMFALCWLFPFEFILLKCDPEMAIDLREAYNEITPGFHMNKKHWNSVSVKGSLSDNFIKQQINNSYDLVRKKQKIINVKS